MVIFVKIDDKIVVLKWGNYGEQNHPNSSPFLSIQSLDVYCFLQVALTSVQHARRDGGGKLYLFFFNSAKR